MSRFAIFLIVCTSGAPVSIAAFADATDEPWLPPLAAPAKPTAWGNVQKDLLDGRRRYVNTIDASRNELSSLAPRAYSSHDPQGHDSSSECVKCGSCDWQCYDVCVRVLPESLLFSPLLANPWEPRFSLKRTWLDNDRGGRVQDATVGGVYGILRLNPYDEPSDGFQIDALGAVLTRLYDRDVVATDYRFGFPLTFRRGPWSGKVGWEHKSTHLGDGLFNAPNTTPARINRDDIVIALSRDFDTGLRLYGVYGVAIGFPYGRYAIVMDNPHRFGCGIEWSRRQRTGLWGQPFAALDLEFRQTQDFVANITSQIGWQWRSRSLRSFRIALEAYTGRSPFGQFFLSREAWFGLGTFLDF